MQPYMKHDFRHLYSILGQVGWHFIAADAAGADQDNVEKLSDVVDLKGYGSGEAEIAWNALAVTDAKKLDLTVKLYQSDNGTDFDAGTIINLSGAKETVFTAAAPVLSGKGVLRLPLDFTHLKRYVKIGVTGDLTHTDTDTAMYTGLIVAGGVARMPAAT